MSLPAIILIVLATFVAMEFVAWASHKYIMHGWGWGGTATIMSRMTSALKRMICTGWSARR